MRFSVIVTTRNRPSLLRRAIASILSQTETSYELIVIDDGSHPQHAAEYDAVARELIGKAHVFHLPTSETGVGPSRARNTALKHCRGDFVAFLDDDDEWTDTDYLRLAAAAMDSHADCELHLANQTAILPNGTVANGPIWLEDLIEKLPPSRHTTGWHVVALTDLLRSDRFCHLNTLIISRKLLERLGGFDESIPYEEDRDLYLRAIETADRIIYSPRVVARHHISDPARRETASNRMSAQERRQWRLAVLDKAVSRTRHQALARYCRRLKGYLLRAQATQEASAKNYEASLRSALDALDTTFSYKWLGFVGWVWLRRIF